MVAVCLLWEPLGQTAFLLCHSHVSPSALLSPSASALVPTLVFRHRKDTEKGDGHQIQDSGEGRYFWGGKSKRTSEPKVIEAT